MLASRVLITAGTPGHMYLDDRQAKCLEEQGGGRACYRRSRSVKLHKDISPSHRKVSDVFFFDTAYETLTHVIAW